MYELTTKYEIYRSINQSPETHITYHRDVSPPVRTLAEDLWFPEGPVAMSDGSVLLVEIRAARLTRVAPDGARTTVTEWGDPLGAGPNGAAIGPDGFVYVCNNGGFWWHEVADGVWIPQDPATGSVQPPNYTTGSIDRVDLDTGTITTVYTDV